MPKFKCKNPECLFFEVEKLEGKVTYRMIEGKIRALEAYCPSCNTEREEVVEKQEYTPPTYEAVGITSNRRNFTKTYGKKNSIY